MAERKADTHAKIVLGDLVVKAGLADEDSAVILGILVEAAAALQASDGELARGRFRHVGAAALSADKVAF